MLTYLEETSLFDSPAQTLVNTVNTVGVMGKGIAAEFKRIYPKMHEEYRNICLAGKLTVGKLYIYRTANKIIVNFPTKKHWRERSRVAYIERGLKKFVQHYVEFGISSVSFPQLGCGHGELDWEKDVEPVMRRYLAELPLPVYIHLYPKPSDFAPERLDPDYAKEVYMLERQRISSEQVWRDLEKVIEKESRSPSNLELFGENIEINKDYLIFKSLTDEAKVFKEEIEDLWNLLRIRGTVNEKDISQGIAGSQFTRSLFSILGCLAYVKPVSLRTKAGPPIHGLRYVPPPEESSLLGNETII
jgi:O-acetyl-ADP-ribose deacetylase (regulator of RNase III)